MLAAKSSWRDDRNITFSTSSCSGQLIMMAASTSVRPHSASGSGSSTPWLSPEASSSAWRGSYPTSTDLSRSASLNATMNASESSQEWWEHVLPPGQLAERLRKAQRSSNSSRRRNNPALANATPSERSAWKRLSGLPKEHKPHDRSESSTAASSRRSSFQGGAAATLPRSALRSSLRSHDSTTSHKAGSFSQSESSAEVSSDELGGTSTRQHSPQHHLRFAFPTDVSAAGERDSASRPSRRAGVRTSINSPEMGSSPAFPEAFDSHRSFSRSSSGRRLRVMSEDGMATSLFTSVQTSTSSYRLPASQSATHLSQHGAYYASASNAADQSKVKVSSHSLPETPEFSFRRCCRCDHLQHHHHSARSQDQHDKDDHPICTIVQGSIASHHPSISLRPTGSGALHFGFGGHRRLH